MAQAGKICDDQAYECPFCLEDFVNPVTLDCGHNLCLECAKRLAFRGTLAQKENAAFTASCQGASVSGGSSKCESPPGFDCPLCRNRTVLDEKKGVEGLPPNISLRNFVDSRRKALSSIPQCGVCNEAEAKWTCQMCADTSFCEKCVQQHETTFAAISWLKDKHNVAAARPKPKVRPLRPCPEHLDETLKCFCVQDECLVCRDCLQFESHKGHESVLLKDAAAFCNTRIQELMASAGVLLPEIAEAACFETADAELTKNYENGVGQVNQAFDDLIKNIGAERTKLLAKLEASYTARKRHIACNVGGYRMYKAALDKLVQDVAANDAALKAQQSHDNLTSAYLETVHLLTRLKAVMKVSIYSLTLSSTPRSSQARLLVQDLARINAKMF
eukprot:TRINITY_DN2886_c3_g2::TRINITY_DN2886_c3_g2_i1::g.6243::m.6243 TRINITY_DN2886_c3_g2::TRINITY_DN2886_c3_g2_i1::g.6243  ORF type:complete len:416 (+),score=56.93,sp/O15344/TRI18_HUMAN/26.09/1e-15,zf-B_box/PF00643.19/1.5e+03,zf-B_box/PF00643.19/1.1e+04,zf-B_box/PF00643.19/0.00066,zf-B_box/PF00643.19/3.5e-07,zf-C3HC4_4/PF15227.1/1.7e-08,zf-C3HC4_4/PF15227.1/6.7e+02,zf-C3HC4_4/PF15227.1/2.6e+03,zf-C3HC4_4/PF15227.1/3.8e+03,zf-C3HC4_2/PF13923.1/1.1e-07,zf-C3HC4_2/PF13923.1/2.3e+03,zf-C3HC4_2/PF13923.1/